MFVRTSYSVFNLIQETFWNETCAFCLRYYFIIQERNTSKFLYLCVVLDYFEIVSRYSQTSVIRTWFLGRPSITPAS